jgi:hypothetical protein
MGIHACAPEGTDCPALALGGSDARESDPARRRPADGSRETRKLSDRPLGSYRQTRQGLLMPLGAFRSGHSLGRMVTIFGKRPTNLLRACNQGVDDKGRYHSEG